ncbi:hypothetical protein [Glutamicibacter sp. V16R2B1]|uniref:hypothetical protein n=1 Tax=Glutamicibacter sp. V16R2B1 TaxID=2036207 RepID=UPI0010FDEF9D|nr:hypothetical protein [Glutamicibacter sp. V16R2B1]MCK9901245.1 hypothetical protein [Frankia sp. Cpl3]TLK46879.1 hypothetical protein FDN03_16085 [Glutamicibacter sp. V16R2B1]
MTQENPADRRTVDDVLADMDDILDNWHGSLDSMSWSPDRGVENAGWTGGGFFYFDGGPVEYDQANVAAAAERWERAIGGWSANAPTIANAPTATREYYREAFQRVADRVRGQVMGSIQEETERLQDIAYGYNPGARPRDTPTMGRVSDDAFTAPARGSHDGFWTVFDDRCRLWAEQHYSAPAPPGDNRPGEQHHEPDDEQDHAEQVRAHDDRVEQHE